MCYASEVVFLRSTGHSKSEAINRSGKIKRLRINNGMSRLQYTIIRLLRDLVDSAQNSPLRVMLQSRNTDLLKGHRGRSASRWIGEDAARLLHEL